MAPLLETLMYKIVRTRKMRAFLKKVWLNGYNAGRVSYHLHGPGANIKEAVEEYLNHEELSW